jgi:N-acetylglucosamine-6-phosphate deacetylase
LSGNAISGRDPATGLPLTIEIADGRIAAVRPGPAGETAWLAPGLVDLQLNGYGGVDLNAPGLTAEAVAALARIVAATGTTTFAPTLITASEERITASLRAIARARRQDPLALHMIPFVHVEGPHISPEDGPRGAHPAAWVRPPDPAELERWQAAGDGLVGLVTLSAHWPQAPAYIRELRRRGIRAAIGHTHASPEEIVAAAEAGATLSTHLGNGAHAMLPRHPNYIWAQLAEDRLSASFIADGHHLPAAALKAMLRAKGLERCLLVSDATALAGMPPGIHDSPIGGRVELTADGRLGIAGTAFLAGAATPLLRGVAGAVRLAGLTLAQALRLATANPGRLAGAGGSLDPGACADLIRFRWAEGDRGLSLDTVLVQGREPR